MFPMASLHADDALRLANERLDGYRAEAGLVRSGIAQAAPNRFGRVRAIVRSIRTAARELPDQPTIRLIDYPYRA